MATEKLNTQQFLDLAKIYPVLDVRSPAEFTHAHIPEAHNVPLFTNEERKIVGTIYKQQSRETAIKTGLDFFGPKMRTMVEVVESLSAQSKSGKQVLVHCWRGGMRSAAIAWLLDLYGFKVYTLVGGYKLYRRWVLNQFQLPYSFNILGGFTGSGKTEVLKELERSGETVIDLEALALHKGSAFGNINQPPQPSQEMFENLLANELYFKSDPQFLNSNLTTVWLEDESQRIGSLNIPNSLWLLMRRSKIYFLEASFSKRLEHIVNEYGNFEKTKMIDAINRIQKRLGGLETKTAITFLDEGKIEEAFRVLLKYYDKCYLKGLNNRENIEQLCKKIPVDNIDAHSNAKLIKRIRENYSYSIA